MAGPFDTAPSRLAAGNDQRQVVTTSALEDWLWRGDHPIVKEMPWYVYSMWVYRVERMPRKHRANAEPRFIDIAFSSDYKLHHTHRQRLATEFRVPLYEGFTMPPSTRDSETAAMYKSLLLRQLSVPAGEEPEDVRFAKAFVPLCKIEGKPVDGNNAFTEAWLAHVEQQKVWAAQAARRFLDRYEYMSLWETQEVQAELYAMRQATQEDVDQQNSPGGRSPREASEVAPDPDEGKLRATVKQYAALVAQRVQAHLEGLARARVEKRPRAYTTDAEIHQSYITATSGGAQRAEDEPEDNPAVDEAPQKSQEVFPLLRGTFDSDAMRAILDFDHKMRPGLGLKDLRSLPFMAKRAGPQQLTETIERQRAEVIV